MYIKSTKYVVSEKDMAHRMVFALMHHGEDHKNPISTIGIFDSIDAAMNVLDDDMCEYYGGTFDDGDFYIQEIPFNYTRDELKKFHEIFVFVEDKSD